MRLETINLLYCGDENCLWRDYSCAVIEIVFEWFSFPKWKSVTDDRNGGGGGRWRGGVKGRGGRGGERRWRVNEIIHLFFCVRCLHLKEWHKLKFNFNEDYDDGKGRRGIKRRKKKKRRRRMTRVDDPVKTVSFLIFLDGPRLIAGRNWSSLERIRQFSIFKRELRNEWRERLWYSCGGLNERIPTVGRREKEHLIATKSEQIAFFNRQKLFFSIMRKLIWDMRLVRKTCSFVLRKSSAFTSTVRGRWQWSIYLLVL